MKIVVIGHGMVGHKFLEQLHALGLPGAQVTVLCEEIHHHVKEEEKPGEGFFAQARKTDVDLKALRDQLMARKQELMQQAENGGLPPAKLTAVQLQAA